MTRFYDLDDANATLPEVRTILETLRDQRAELIRLRDQVLASRPSSETRTDARSETRSDAPTGANVGGASRSPEPVAPSEPSATSDQAEPATDADPNAGSADPDVRILRLRMQGVIDRMQAGVARIDELGITLREIENGLIDYPALASGRQIWLCWRLGEGNIEFWHELSEGFTGRQPLAELT